MKYTLSCLFCGKVFLTDNGNKKTCSAECSMELKKLRDKRRRQITLAFIQEQKIKSVVPIEKFCYKDSLCWLCKKSTNNGCNWSKEFKPVKGWDAKETLKKSSSPEMSRSYNVTSCPEFVRG